MMGYDAPYGTGDRQAVITITVSDDTLGSGSPSLFIDGLNNANLWWKNGYPIANKYVRFQFAESIIVTEIRLRQQYGAGTNGTWQVQGSADGVSWDNIGSTFVMDATSDTLFDISANITDYLYYQVLGISGTLNYNAYLLEFEFSWTYPVSAGNPWNYYAQM